MNKTIHRTIARFSLMIVVSILLGAAAVFSGNAVPMRLQQALLLKSVAYAKGTVSRAAGEFKIGVLYDADSADVKSDFEKSCGEHRRTILFPVLPHPYLFSENVFLWIPCY